MSNTFGTTMFTDSMLRLKNNVSFLSVKRYSISERILVFDDSDAQLPDRVVEREAEQ